MGVRALSRGIRKHHDKLQARPFLFISLRALHADLFQGFLRLRDFLVPRQRGVLLRGDLSPGQTRQKSTKT